MGQSLVWNMNTTNSKSAHMTSRREPLWMFFAKILLCGCVAKLLFQQTSKTGKSFVASENLLETADTNNRLFKNSRRLVNNGSDQTQEDQRDFVPLGINATDKPMTHQWQLQDRHVQEDDAREKVKKQERPKNDLNPCSCCYNCFNEEKNKAALEFWKLVQDAINKKSHQWRLRDEAKDSLRREIGRWRFHLRNLEVVDDSNSDSDYSTWPSPQLEPQLAPKNSSTLTSPEELTSARESVLNFELKSKLKFEPKLERKFKSASERLNKLIELEKLIYKDYGEAAVDDDDGDVDSDDKIGIYYYDDEGYIYEYDEDEVDDYDDEAEVDYHNDEVDNRINKVDDNDDNTERKMEGKLSDSNIMEYNGHLYDCNSPKKDHDYYRNSFRYGQANKNNDSLEQKNSYRCASSSRLIQRLLSNKKSGSGLVFKAIKPQQVLNAAQPQQFTGWTNFFHGNALEDYWERKNDLIAQREELNRSNPHLQVKQKVEQQKQHKEQVKQDQQPPLVQVLQMLPFMNSTSKLVLPKTSFQERWQPSSPNMRQLLLASTELQIPVSLIQSSLQSTQTQSQVPSISLKEERLSFLPGAQQRLLTAVQSNPSSTLSIIPYQQSSMIMGNQQFLSNLNNSKIDSKRQHLLASKQHQFPLLYSTPESDVATEQKFEMLPELMQSGITAYSDKQKGTSDNLLRKTAKQKESRDFLRGSNKNTLSTYTFPVSYSQFQESKKVTQDISNQVLNNERLSEQKLIKQDSHSIPSLNHNIKFIQPLELNEQDKSKKTPNFQNVFKLEEMQPIWDKEEIDWRRRQMLELSGQQQNEKTDEEESLKDKEDKQKEKITGMMFKRYRPTVQQVLPEIESSIAYGPWAVNWGKDSPDRVAQISVGNNRGVVGISEGLNYRIHVANVNWGINAINAMADELHENFKVGVLRGKYGVNVNRSPKLQSTSVETVSRYVETASLADQLDDIYGQRVRVRQFEISLQSDLSTANTFEDLQNNEVFMQEIALNYRSFSLIVGIDPLDHLYAASIGLRGYEFSALVNMSTRIWDFQGFWGRGWQMILQGDFPDPSEEEFYAVIGFGRAGRLYVAVGGGIANDNVPEGTFEVQSSNFGMSIFFLDFKSTKVLNYALSLGKFSYSWESVVVLDNLRIPLLIEPPK